MSRINKGIEAGVYIVHSDPLLKTDHKTEHLFDMFIKNVVYELFFLQVIHSMMQKNYALVKFMICMYSYMLF